MDKNEKFEIGDRVRIKDYADLPEECRNSGFAKTCGKEGEIVDMIWSRAKQAGLYRICFDGNEKASRADYPEGSFESIPDIPDATYRFEFDFAENVVIAIFYEYRRYENQVESKTELARAHGHIIHEGAIGIAQATSYAVKRCYDKVAGNDTTKSYYFNK